MRACSLCSGAGISCDYQEVHPGHSSPRNDDGSNSNSRDNGQTSSSASSKTMADLQRMLGQLESLVRWQSTLLEQQQTQLQSMKHSQPLPASSSPKVPADTTVITAPTTTARASVSSSGSLCGDNDTCDMSDVGDMGGADNTDDTLHDIGAQTEITNGSAAVDTPGLFSSSLPVLPPLLFATTGHNSHDVDSMAAPLHHTSGSPEMMDHDGGRAMNNGNIGNNGDNSNNSKNDGNDNNDNNNSNDNDDDDEEEPLTIPVGHLTPRGSLFVLEPIQKLIGEYPEDYFLQIEALRVYHPTCRRRYSHGTHANHGWPGHGLGGALSGLCLDKNYTDMLVAAFFTNVQPHYPIVDADSFMPFVDRVLGQQHTAWMEDPMQSEDDAEIDVALCLTVLALGQLVHRQDHPENGVGISPMSTTAGVGMEAPEAIEPTDDSESYFAIAYEILMRRWATCFKPSVAYASALVHGAIYLCYLDRPLPAWALVHMASIKLQTIVVQ
ncbi:hypothetical protein SBRCBS47491_002504 [Sporothrix bragantina]|uniref:Transcription factor domain-containing protein n=1 Tax=Sporothrix bragantina TaxID=671064 RepID=A0ABP0B7L9_9PEZI